MRKFWTVKISDPNISNAKIFQRSHCQKILTSKIFASNVLVCFLILSHLFLLDKCEILQKQNKEASRTIKEQKDLIVQLENDVLNLNSLPSTFRGQGEGEATPSPDTELVEKAVQGALQQGMCCLFIM